MNVYEFLQNPTPDIYFSDHITLDIETTNINYGDSTKADNHIVLTSFLHNNTMTTVEGGMGKLDGLIEKIENLEGFIVGQNIKFDLRWLARMGLDLSKVIVWDTMIAEHVFYGNRSPTTPIDLGSIAKRYGMAGKEPIVDSMIRGGICPSQIPRSLLIRRCEDDVRKTDYIFRQQLARAIQEDKLATILTRCILTPILADMEVQGLILDEKVVREEYTKALLEQQDVAKQLQALKDINWNSPKQVGEYLYEELGFKELSNRGEPIRTNTGKYKADVSTIRKLSARTKQQKHVQSLLSRSSIVEAQLSKTLSKFNACVENGDILYAQFNQAVTQTHRLSSTGTEYGVQFQNMPRIFKPCVRARHEDWEIWEVDGAQLEFRVAGFLTQDPQVKADIINDEDVHSYTAQVLTESGQPTTRQEAKASTFKPLFGGRSGTEAEKAYYEAFKKKYNVVTQTQERWKADAIRDKKIRIPSGLEFFFPTIKAPRNADGWIKEESNIYNYPIQSFATADIIPISVTYLWHEMKHHKLQSFLVNTVHDSAIAEVEPTEGEKLNELMRNSFGNSCYNYLKKVYNVEFNIPLGCGIKVGSNWGKGVETKYTLPTPY